jgi:hypothetical protein
VQPARRIRAEIIGGLKIRQISAFEAGLYTSRSLLFQQELILLPGDGWLSIPAALDVTGGRASPIFWL